MKNANVKPGSVASFLLAVMLAAGCRGGDGPPTVAVRGIIVAENEDSAALAGHQIEFVSVKDSAVRAFAEIQPGGHFELSTMHEGHVWPGALPGDYRIRLVLSDDDPTARKLILQVYDRRPLDLKATPWKAAIPTRDPLLFRLDRQ
ncbi:hypothetical protein AB1L30_10025 [Bremerella sp. JC817]|uniref:hypothetical protein n=1 Tax=Bremerella sp. JC817 TaxID=3231756 RepID=UPI0034593C6E